MWVNQFFKHLPYWYKQMKKRPLDPKHVHAEDIAAIMTWYDHLEILVRQFQIQPSDIYNFDKIDFLERQGHPEAVITCFSEKNESLDSFFSCSSATVMKCVCRWLSSFSMHYLEREGVFRGLVYTFRDARDLVDCYFSNWIYIWWSCF